MKNTIGAFLKFLIYPYLMIKKYYNYNIRIGKVIKENKDPELNRLRIHNLLLVLLFICFPVIVGLAVHSILSGYLISIIGAKFLSLNPAFKEEEKISKILVSLGYDLTVTWIP